MPAPSKGPRLGGGPAHERLLLGQLASQLFEHRSIRTTEAKAKRLRPVAERLVTFAKRGDLHARRRVMRTIGDKTVVHELFTEIAPLVHDRPGGYTRIVKVGYRKGDNAPMAVIELVLEPVTPKRRAATRSSAEEAAVSAAPTVDPAEGAEPEQSAPVEPEATTDAAAEVEAQAAADAPEAEAQPTGSPADTDLAAQATEQVGEEPPTTA